MAPEGLREVVTSSDGSTARAKCAANSSSATSHSASSSSGTTMVWSASLVFSIVCQGARREGRPLGTARRRPHGAPWAQLEAAAPVLARAPSLRPPAASRAPSSWPPEVGGRAGEQPPPPPPPPPRWTEARTDALCRSLPYTSFLRCLFLMCDVCCPIDLPEPRSLGAPSSPRSARRGRSSSPSSSSRPRFPICLFLALRCVFESHGARARCNNENM